MRISRLLPLFLFAVLFTAGCVTGGRTPFTGSMARIDAGAVNNGEKALVIMRVSSPWGTPAETRWLHVESGQLYMVTSKFAAGTQQTAKEYDMVTLPPGRYVLTYVLYSEDTGPALPSNVFDINPNLSKVSTLGQVNTEKGGKSGHITSALRSTGLAKDGKTPLIAAFTVNRGEVVYLGDMTIQFTIDGKVQLPGYYPAGTVAWSVRDDLERARLALSNEDAALGTKLRQGRVTRGTLAKNL